jgi:phosphoribosyl-AMP cyclohydrolase / phosphoribosyl-ATP pyrophosphohydrolase
VILGTAARPEVLSLLPRERVIAALDARHGEVVVEGWTKATGAAVLDRIAQLRELVGGFLVTFVEREGRLGGTDLDFARQIRQAAGKAAVTIAGGITTPDEVRELDRIGCDAQIGMALYTGRLPLAEAFAAALTSDRPDGLWPTVVVDERGVALGLCWSDLDSLGTALERGVGAYHSRSRGLWVKGETSGATQELLAVAADCDRDALRFTVRQAGTGFCHLDTRTCWGEEAGLGALARRLQARRASAPAGSYTARLFADPALLAAKLREEADELARAATPAEVVHEAADVLYFTLATLARHGVDLAAVEAALERRALKVTRRS